MITPRILAPTLPGMGPHHHSPSTSSPHNPHPALIRFPFCKSNARHGLELYNPSPPPLPCRSHPVASNRPWSKMSATPASQSSPRTLTPPSSTTYCVTSSMTLLAPMSTARWTSASTRVLLLLDRS